MEFDRDGEPHFDSACSRRDYYKQKEIDRLTAENKRLRHLLSRILSSTPHSMCSDALAWADAESVTATYPTDEPTVTERMTIAEYRRAATDIASLEAQLANYRLEVIVASGVAPGDPTDDVSVLQHIAHRRQQLAKALAERARYGDTVTSKIGDLEAQLAEKTVMIDEMIHTSTRRQLDLEADIDRLTAENKRLREWAREALPMLQEWYMGDAIDTRMEQGFRNHNEKIRRLQATYPADEADGD